MKPIDSWTFIYPHGYIATEEVTYFQEQVRIPKDCAMPLWVSVDREKFPDGQCLKVTPDLQRNKHLPIDIASALCYVVKGMVPLHIMNTRQKSVSMRGQKIHYTLEMCADVTKPKNICVFCTKRLKNTDMAKYSVSAVSANKIVPTCEPGEQPIASPAVSSPRAVLGEEITTPTDQQPNVAHTSLQQPQLTGETSPNPNGPVLNPKPVENSSTQPNRPVLNPKPVENSSTQPNPHTESAAQYGPEVENDSTKSNSNPETAEPDTELLYACAQCAAKMPENYAIAVEQNLSKSEMNPSKKEGMEAFTKYTEALKAAGVTPKNVYEVDMTDMPTAEKAGLLRETQLFLSSFAAAFAGSEEDVGFTKIAEHYIDVGNCRPIGQRPRRLAAAELDAVNAEMDDMIKKGVIEPSCSAWASPIVMVKKKDGSNRFCIDYRKLNDITVKDRFPLPRIDDTLDAVSQGLVFSTVDLKSGYWQLGLEKSSADRGAFVSHRGQWQFKVMPFGLTNAPATFQRMMNMLMAGLTAEVCCCFLDDVIVFSRSVEEHMWDLGRVLYRFFRANLKLKGKKCKFFQERVDCLGHVVSGKGIETNPDKTEQVQQCRPPKSVKEVRSFLGLTGYYRKFIKNYSILSLPLTDLTKKGIDERKWAELWGEPQQSAFQALKDALVGENVLKFPDINKPFILATDASNSAVGWVLSQLDENGEERPCGYGGRKFKAAEVNYSVPEKECLAIITGFRANRIYLAGNHTSVRTDHKCLVRVLKIKANIDYLSDRLFRWAMLLQEYDYDLDYVKGVDNGNADAMSREPLCDCDPMVFLKKLKGKKQGDLELKTNGEISQKDKITPATEVVPAQGVSTMDINTEPMIDSYDLGWLEREPHEGNVELCAAEAVEKGPSTDEEVLRAAHNAIWDSLGSEPGFYTKRVRRCQNDDPEIKPIIEIFKGNQEALNPEELATAQKLMKIMDCVFVNEVVMVQNDRRACPLAKPNRRCKSHYKLLVPVCLQNEVLTAFHGDRSMHRNAAFTLNLMSDSFYWATMRKDLIKFVDECVSCALYTRGPNLKQALMPIASRERLAMWGFDFLGPFPASEPDGFKHLVTFQDYFTKWPEAYPVKDTSAESLIKAFNWLKAANGTPKIVISDRGPSIMSKRFKEYLEKLGIQHNPVAAYNQHANGQVESFNKIFKTMLKPFTDDNVVSWPDFVPMVLEMYRASPNLAIGETPYYMKMAKDISLPINNILHRIVEIESPIHCSRKLFQNVLQACQEAAKTLDGTQEDYKRRHDIHKGKQQFAPGDLVIRQVRAVTAGKGMAGVFSPYFDRFYRVTAVKMPNITVEALLGGAVIENDASQNYRLFRGTKDQIEKYLEGKRRKGEPKEDARDWRCGKCSQLYHRLTRRELNQGKKDERWIECEGCLEWWHDTCVGLGELF